MARPTANPISAMTISIKQILDPSARNRAGALLGLAPNADPDECRRAALSQIEAADYDPTPAWHAAAELLFSLPAEPDAAAHTATPLALREEIETQLHDQVEEFAVTMIQLEPAARLRRWNELRTAAGFSRPLQRRLELLSPGLDLCPPSNETLGSDRQGQLTRWILTLFPLRPVARSVSYIQALDALREAPPEWESAAAKLEKTQPGLVRLAPDLIIAARSCKLQRQAVERQAKRRRREARREAWSRWRASTSASPIWILLLVVGLGARFVAGLSKMESRPSNNRPSLSAKDIQSAQEFFERMQRQQEAFDRQSKGITPADLQRESGSPFELDSPEVRKGMEALHLIQELQRQREEKKSGNPAKETTDQEPPPTPFATEENEPEAPRQPETKEADPRRDGADP